MSPRRWRRGYGSLALARRTLQRTIISPHATPMTAPLTPPARKPIGHDQNATISQRSIAAGDPARRASQSKKNIAPQLSDAAVIADVVGTASTKMPAVL